MWLPTLYQYTAIGGFTYEGPESFMPRAPCIQPEFGVKNSDAAVKPSIAPYRSSTGRSTCVMNFAGSLCWGGPSR